MSNGTPIIQLLGGQHGKKLDKVTEQHEYDRVYTIASKSTANDLRIMNDEQFEASSHDRFVVGIRYKSRLATALPIFFFTTEESSSQSNNKRIDGSYDISGNPAEGDIVEVTFDCASHPLWTGKITLTRFDPLTGKLEFEIPYIRFDKKNDDNTYTPYKVWDFANATDTMGWYGRCVEGALKVKNGYLYGKSGLQDTKAISAENKFGTIPIRNGDYTFDVGDPVTDMNPSNKRSTAKAVKEGLLSSNRGQYVTGRVYEKGDLVTMPNGISYVAKRDGVTSEPKVEDCGSIVSYDFSNLQVGDELPSTIVDLQSCEAETNDGFLKLTTKSSDVGIVLSVEDFYNKKLGMGSLGSIAFKFRAAKSNWVYMYFWITGVGTKYARVSITSTVDDEWKIGIIDLSTLKSTYALDAEITKMRFDYYNSSAEGDTFDLAWIRFSEDVHGFDNITVDTPDDWKIFGEQFISSPAIVNSVSGTDITVKDSADRYAVGFKVVGKTEDAKCVKQGTKILVGGSNLLPYPYRGTVTKFNGVTVTDNGDGSFTLNGTCTAVGNISIAKNTNIPIPLDKPIVFIAEGISGSVSDKTSYIYAGLFNAAGSDYIRNSNFHLDGIKTISATRNLPNTTNGYNIFVQVGNAGVTFDNYRVRFWINASGHYTQYTPYKEHREITVPCDLSEGDIFYPSSGKVEKNGVTEQYKPQAVTTFKGVTNIYQMPTELSGTLEMDYVADTKLYIDNKIAEMQAMILES